jgi:hypothetical protein
VNDFEKERLDSLASHLFAELYKSKLYAELLEKLYESGRVLTVETAMDIFKKADIHVGIKEVEKLIEKIKRDLTHLTHRRYRKI